MKEYKRRSDPNAASGATTSTDFAVQNEPLADEEDEYGDDDFDFDDDGAEFKVQEEAKPQVAPVSQIELLQTKEQLQNKLLLLKSQVERALSERQFSEAAQAEQTLSSWRLSYMSSSSKGKEAAAESHDFARAVELEAQLNLLKQHKPSAGLSKKAAGPVNRIKELCATFKIESEAADKQIAAASSAKNYAGASRIKETHTKNALENRKRLIILYNKAVLEGGAVAEFKAVWEHIESECPYKEYTPPVSARSPSQFVKTTKSASKGWFGGDSKTAAAKPAGGALGFSAVGALMKLKGKAAKTKKLNLDNKKLTDEQMAASLQRLNKKPDKPNATHSSEDEANNCTFKLDLKAYRKSMAPPKRQQEEWVPPAKGWKPGNAPLVARNSQDGLYQLRQRAASTSGGTQSLGQSTRALR